jgi:hypothetical protein
MLPEALHVSANIGLRQYFCYYIQGVIRIKCAGQINFNTVMLERVSKNKYFGDSYSLSGSFQGDRLPSAI